jgi:pSer/pThr/pTyr-binding forkhead associated (FHA) protein
MSSADEQRRRGGVVAVFQAEDEESEGCVYEIRDGENRMGRALDNDLVFASQWVSRYHAVLECDDGILVVVPMKGKRIKVNGSESQGAEIQLGDLVQLGMTSLRLREPRW